MRKPIYLFLCLAALFLTGCTSTAEQKKGNTKKEELELKRNRFNALQKEVEDNTLVRGTTPSEIKETYGKPDSVFSSGSGDSSFELWTYERVLLPGEEEDWQPIRLYFNSGKLTNWKH